MHFMVSHVQNICVCVALSVCVYMGMDPIVKFIARREQEFKYNLRPLDHNKAWCSFNLFSSSTSPTQHQFI
jgi:hypothetical protein